MKKILATAAVISALSFSADAAERKFPYWYLGLSGGVAHQNDSELEGAGGLEIEWDTGFIASASIGYQPPVLAGFRPELEYSFRKQDIEDGSDITVNVVAANLYYDIVTPGTVTPYIGAGIGYGHFDIDTGSTGLDGSSSEAIYQGMIGLGYEPSGIQNVGFTLGYRYMAPFSDPDVEGFDYEYDNHSVEIGAKFRF